MIRFARTRSITLLAVGLSLLAGRPFRSQVRPSAPGTPARPAEIQISDGPLPTRVLAPSPADTSTELQVNCLFQSGPSTHGPLTEIDERLKGLLGRIRTATFFRRELSETILITPPAGRLGA